jgi:replicative DNA helicase
MMQPKTQKMLSPFPDPRREQYLERALPSSEDSERVIIGAVLLDNALITQAVDHITPEDFYSPLNRRVFTAMFALFGRASEISPQLIIEEMKKDGPVDAIGGISTIANLTYGLPHFSNIGEYVRVVKDKSNIRKLIRACNEITSEALTEEDDAGTILDRAEQAIFNVCERRSESEPELASDIAADEIKTREEMMRTGVRFDGLASGLSALDRDLGGLKKSDLIIVAARPSMGKTALCLTIAQNAAVRENAVVALFSLEMSKKQLISRLLCSEARVNLHEYINGRLPRFDFQEVVEAQKVFRDRKLVIDDTAGITPMQVLSRCRKIYSKFKKLDLVVVDYLQLMRSGARNESRRHEVEQISRDLKAIAKVLNVPVIALSQLSRECEKRSPPRPIMSDLRESGTIEQDADIVLFVFREDYYHETEENKGKAEIIIAKQRNGPTGTVHTSFVRKFAKFEDLGW